LKGIEGHTPAARGAHTLGASAAATSWSPQPPLHGGLQRVAPDWLLVAAESDKSVLARTPCESAPLNIFFTQLKARHRNLDLYLLLFESFCDISVCSTQSSNAVIWL
jgi:hypothetical protein